jgi:8-oxo-dGTP pyrophosphatase MutT (NUDIX family)
VIAAQIKRAMSGVVVVYRHSLPSVSTTFCDRVAGLKEPVESCFCRIRLVRTARLFLCDDDFDVVSRRTMDLDFPPLLLLQLLFPLLLLLLLLPTIESLVQPAREASRCYRCYDNRPMSAEVVIHDFVPLNASGFDDCMLEYDTHYNGVSIRLDRWNREDALDPLVYEQSLVESLQLWRTQGKKGIWIHVPLHRADWVPMAVRHGFTYHMVASSEDCLILNQWLPTDGPSRLPKGPHNQLGVGCVVLHPQDVCGNHQANSVRMLVVQEKTGPARTWNLWKMPTGLVDADEDIHEAALRELQEETGLQGCFQGILAVRHSHSVARASDIFAVCVLSLPFLHPWRPCEEEIHDIAWMPVTEYCAQERWQQSPVHVELNQAIWEYAQASVSGAPARAAQLLFRSTTLELGFGIKPPAGQPSILNTLYKVNASSATDESKL